MFHRTLRRLAPNLCVVNSDFQEKYGDIMLKRSSPRPGYTLIFRPWIHHPKTGQVIYPKRGKVFPLWVKTDGEQLNLHLN